MYSSSSSTEERTKALERFLTPWPSHTRFGNIDSATFKIRSKRYMDDQKKVTSEPAMYTHQNMQCIRGKNGIIDRFELYQRLLAQNLVDTDSPACFKVDKLPTTIVINKQMPEDAPSMLFGPNRETDFGLSMIDYFTINEHGLKDEEEKGPQTRLFLDVLRKGRSSKTGPCLKVIGQCSDFKSTGLPNMVERFNGKPALVSKCMHILTKHNVVILDMDFRPWCYLARQAWYAGTMQDHGDQAMQTAWLVEGRCEADLPERVMCCFQQQDLDRRLCPFVDNQMCEPISSDKDDEDQEEEDDVCQADVAKMKPKKRFSIFEFKTK